MVNPKPKTRHDEWKRMKEMQIAHLAGVFDAAGSVRLRVVKNDDYQLGYTLRPVLRMLRPKDEDLIFGKLASYCDEQGVNYSFSDTGNNSTEWTVTDPGSVERFLDPMVDHLVENYIRAEMMTGVVLPALDEGNHLEKQSFYEMMELVEALRKEKVQGKKPKYTQKYFREKWSEELSTE